MTTRKELEAVLEARRNRLAEEYHGENRGNWGNDFAKGHASLEAALMTALEALFNICNVYNCDPVLDANDRYDIADKAYEKIMKELE